MIIRKYTEFIKEELQDTPESYISVALTSLKKKIDRMFDYQESIEKRDQDNPDKIKKVKKNDNMSFEDLGVRLESSEISKYSKLYDSLTVKFSDDNNTYALIIMIDIKEAIPKDPEKDFEIQDIDECYIKFKKYDLDTFEVIGQLSKNVKFNKIDEDFLIDLKIELDDKFGDDEEFKIETK